MAKGKEKTAAEIAAEKAAAEQGAQNERPSFAEALAAAKDKSLSSGEKVILANLVQEAWIKDPAYGNIVDGATVLRDALMGDIIVTQLLNGKDTFALIVRKDENRYLSIKNMLAGQGISLPDFKALPAPTQDQLDAAGVKLLPAETAMIKIDSSNVSEEALEQKKKEQKIESEKPSTNPAEIKDTEELKKSLSYLLTSGSENLDSRVQRTIDFYRGYLTIQANHAENKTEALAALKEKSRSTMLSEIVELVGPCPFAFRGAAHMLLTRLESTKTVIVPFCLYRRTADKKNKLEDDYICDIVRILTTWSCNTKIANANRTIAECERVIRKNEAIVKDNKDAKEVKVAESTIKTFKETIEKQKAIVDGLNSLIGIINNPTFDGVDSLIEDFDKEEGSDEYKNAHMIVDTIMKTYYKDIDVAKANKESMLKNVQQRAGIIINMFRGALAQSMTYAEGNLTDIVVEEQKAE